MSTQERYTYGKEMSPHELVTVVQVLTGRPVRRLVGPLPKIARVLYEAAPLRFEFEVNRLRGFAWNHGETPGPGSGGGSGGGGPSARGGDPLGSAFRARAQR